jgi:hypothetical protein
VIKKVSAKQFKASKKASCMKKAKAKKSAKAKKRCRRISPPARIRSRAPTEGAGNRGGPPSGGPSSCSAERRRPLLGSAVSL